MKNVSIAGILLLISLVVIGLITKDVLFAKPEHEQGIIIEKIFVPGRMVSGHTPYGGAKRSKYFVTHQKQDQWVAIVKMDAGDTVKVHCMIDHYNSKNVGDVLRFKKYDGHLVHIDYFAHNEEED
jgi:hypothetical protein